MWPFDEIEDVVESVVGTVAEVTSGIGDAVDTVVRTGTELVSNLDVSDVAGIAGTFLGGPVGAMAGQAIGGLLEGGGDWGSIVSGAIGGLGGGLLPSPLGGIADSLLGGGTLLGGAEAFLGGGLDHLGSMATNLLGGAATFGDFSGLAEGFAGAAGRLSELVTGEGDDGGGMWPLSQLLDQAGLGGAEGNGNTGFGGGVFADILEAAGIDVGNGAGAGGAGGAGDAATSGPAGETSDGGLFAQILERAGIQMPTNGSPEGPAAAQDDDGDAGMFRDILERAGIETGRGADADRPGAPNAAVATSSPAAPSSIQDVVGALGASGGLAAVLGQMPQNELTDLVLTLARPQAADAGGTDAAAATDRADDGSVEGGDVLGADSVTSSIAVGDDLADATAGGSYSDAPTDSGPALGADGSSDDLGLTLPGDEAPAQPELVEYAEPEPSAFSQDIDAADAVEDSFDSLFTQDGM